jgi:thioredoxin-related protein
MKFPRFALSALLALCGMLVTSRAAQQWETNYQAALEQAARENKLLLLDFTGSDWCAWCIKLKKDTFSKPEFQKLAEEKLVLVELDFPRSKAQSDEVKKQNLELAEKFGIEGFPTLVLLDPQGKEVARNVGYLAGGPEGFSKWVESVRQQ